MVVIAEDEELAVLTREFTQSCKLWKFSWCQMRPRKCTRTKNDCYRCRNPGQNSTYFSRDIKNLNSRHAQLVLIYISTKRLPFQHCACWKTMHQEKLSNNTTWSRKSVRNLEIQSPQVTVPTRQWQKSKMLCCQYPSPPEKLVTRLKRGGSIRNGWCTIHTWWHKDRNQKILHWR